MSTETKVKTTIRTDLLRELAAAIVDRKKRKLDRWDFSVPMMQTECGTVGCALGEARLRWPDHKGRYADLFGINQYHTVHLFFPGGQKLKWGKKLKGTATARQVSSNMIRFCELAEEGKL